MPRSPRLAIEYTNQCRWLARATWTAQELLTTFVEELGEVALVPGKGGVFDARLDGETVWSRATEGRFPELAELKRLLRDHIAPGRSLGHSDSQVKIALAPRPSPSPSHRRERLSQARDRALAGFVADFDLPAPVRGT